MTRLLIALLSLLSLLPLAAMAQYLPADAERVDRFSSHILVGTDGAVTVTEAIAVTVAGKQIEHGIYRVIPVIRRNERGGLVRSELEVLSVRLDGQDAPFAVTDRSNDVFIRIGDPDADLSFGPHSYQIRYRMTRAIDFNADLDRLDWNVTGNDWTSIILEAEAVVELPPGVVVRRAGAWEGPAGSTRSNVTLSQPAPNQQRYAMSGRLLANWGLTIAAEFDKGVVAQPQGYEALSLWLADFADRIWPLVGLALLCLALLVIWLANGSRRPLPRVGPQTTPPEGLTPASAHLIRNMGFTWNGWTTLSAVLFNLEGKGQITLDLDTVPAAMSLVANPLEVDLTPEESAVLTTLAERGPTVRIQRQGGFTFVLAKGRMQLAAREAIGTRYFRRSYRAIALCMALWGAMVAFLAFNGVLSPEGFLFGVLFTGGPATLLCGALQDIRRHLRRRILWLWAGATVIGFALLIAGLFGAIPVSSTAVALAVGLWAAVGTAIAMAAYTREGREAAAGIEAFRRSLLAGNAVSEAEYARYLPWAIALEVEEDWGARLAADLTRAGTPDTALAADQRAMRYVHFGTGHPANCGAVLSSALAAAAPISSRSGGGGGSSGGGGGGGGGGGW